MISTPRLVTRGGWPARIGRSQSCRPLAVNPMLSAVMSACSKRRRQPSSSGSEPTSRASADTFGVLLGLQHDAGGWTVAVVGDEQRDLGGQLGDGVLVEV